MQLAKPDLFDAKNDQYNAANMNCLQVTYELLSLGKLYNGTSASRLFSELYRDYTSDGIPSNSSLIPNIGADRVKSIFYNDAYTISEYKSQLESRYDYFDGLGFFASKIQGANFNKYRINILLGRQNK
ncbi:hypothetical protein D3C87_1015510 [compost metagenome]